MFGSATRVFGVNESVFNGALALRQMENNMSQGDFMYGYFAKYNQETEDIHYLSISKVESMSDSGYSTKHIELKSNRTTKSYELFFIGQFDHFPCGAHLISDGSEIFFRAKPLSGQVANVANCNNDTPEELCLDANDLTEKDSCTLSASDFTK